MRALEGIKVGEGERDMDSRMKRWGVPNHLTAGPWRWKVAAAVAVGGPVVAGGTAAAVER